MDRKHRKLVLELVHMHRMQEQRRIRNRCACGTTYEANRCGDDQNRPKLEHMDHKQQLELVRKQVRKQVRRPSHSPDRIRRTNQLLRLQRSNKERKLPSRKEERIAFQKSPKKLTFCKHEKESLKTMVFAYSRQSAF
ncbi:MAG: hypothetical protein RLY14_2469 [Planctomycetota bacterium]|jgi:hypothetical protein